MDTTDMEILRDAELLWDYHHIGYISEETDEAEDFFPADLILGFGSHDLRVAERCADLYLQGAAGVILFTGGLGRITGSLWREPEAAIFRRTALRAGVPAASILIEESASNTGENIRYSKEIAGRMIFDAAGSGCDLPRILAVDKPGRERRTLAALKKQWPGAVFRITSPRCSFAQCLQYYEQGAGGTGITVRRFINIMVGDLIKMETYADLGFQISQPVPEEVRMACRRLQDMGFSGID